MCERYNVNRLLKLHKLQGHDLRLDAKTAHFVDYSLPSPSSGKTEVLHCER